MRNRSKTLSEFVKWARLEKRLSKNKLARCSYLSEKTIYRVELGENARKLTVAKLAKGLNLPIDDLLAARDQPKEFDDKALLALKSINDELIKYLAKHPPEMHSLSPRKFEYLIAELLRDMGGEIEITPETRDGGRDILAAFNTPIGKI